MSQCKPIVVGSSHRTAALDLLQALSVSPDEIRELLPMMKEDLGLVEAVYLSTCNRTEIYALSEDEDPAACAQKIVTWLLEKCSADVEIDEQHLYRRIDRDAVEHLLRVASGLDSLILGETEITGQIQTSLDLAREVGTASSFSVQLFSTAFRTAKRARTETTIDRGNTSVASASVHLAKRIFGDLRKRSALVVGAGETGQLVLTYLVEQGVGSVTVANRTVSRAQEVAASHGGTGVGLDGIGEALKKADIVICATHSKEPLVTAEMLREALGPRYARMVLIVDISLPRNVDPAAGDLTGVFLNDMKDLKGIVEQALARRLDEIPAVEKIIDEELGKFDQQQSVLQTGPLIKELRGRFEELRRQELERFASKISDEERPHVERLTRDLLNKLLHWPTLEIRAMAAEAEINPEKLEWSRRLFGLDKDEQARKGKK